MNLFTNSAALLSGEIEQIMNSVIISVPNWKWLALILGFSLLFLFRGLLVASLILLKRSQKHFGEKNIFVRHLLGLEIEKSISWILLSILAMILTENLDLTLNLEKYLLILCKLFLSYNTICFAYLAVEAFGFVLEAWSAKTSSQIDDQLVPLATKTFKVLVILIGGLIVLQNFGINVTALLAGLGIGGVALAFAAQDTVANVFGTITILLDSPFKLGDRVKILDVEGNVVEVGFRSTRIRTFYNSVITIPNSVVAKEKIDNMSERNNVFRFKTVLGFTYNTTQEQIQNFSENLKYFLKQESIVDQERVTIHFIDFAESSMNVLVSFHYTLNDANLEYKTNENWLFQIHRIANEQKLSFAFPTRTLLIENRPV